MLASLRPDRFIRRWQEILASSDEIAAKARRWLAMVDGAPIGFVSAGPPRDPDPPANAELYAIHVEATHHRQGAGRALLNTALTFLRTLDPGAAYLWVLDANTNARRAYEHLDWKEDGAHRTFESGSHLVGETRYRFSFQ